MSKAVKYIGNVFQSSRLNEAGERTAVEGEFYIKVILPEGVESVTLRSGEYINLLTPEAHYSGLAKAGVLTQDIANEKIQKSKAAGVRLIPVLSNRSKVAGSANTSGF